MEGHVIGGPVLIVISEEVFLQPFEDVFGLVVEQHALVQERAVAPIVIGNEVGVQGQLPDACIRRDTTYTLTSLC